MFHFLVDKVFLLIKFKNYKNLSLSQINFRNLKNYNRHKSYKKYNVFDKEYTLMLVLLHIVSKQNFSLRF